MKPGEVRYRVILNEPQPHPIEDPEIQAEVKAWTQKILDRTGSGKVCVEFDYKDGRCQATRLGGSTGRKKNGA